MLVKKNTGVAFGLGVNAQGSWTVTQAVESIGALLFVRSLSKSTCFYISVGALLMEVWINNPEERFLIIVILR